MLKVKDLIAHLQTLPEESLVIIASDEEGNSYHYVSEEIEKSIADSPILFPIGDSMDPDEITLE